MLFDELRQIEKSGARERVAIRRQCDADIAAIHRQKEEAIAQIDSKHQQTMAAIKADHEEKMKNLHSQSEEIHKAIEEAKAAKDFSKVCELLKAMTESICN